MKEFVKDNLFIVIMIGVVVVCLAVGVFPWMQISEANEHAQELQKLHGQLSSAIVQAQSPKWVKDSDAGILEIRTAQERVIETSLQYGLRRPLLVNGRLIFPTPAQVDRFEFRYAYEQSIKGWLTELKAAQLPGPADPELAQAEQEAAQRAQPGAGAGPGGQPIRVETRDLKSEAWRTVVRNRAASQRIWADLNSFDNYITQLTGRGAAGGLGAGGMTDQQLWPALLNYWVQQDLVEVLKSTNGERTISYERDGTPIKRTPANLTVAPVKELVWVQVEEEYYTGPRQGGGSQQSGTTELTGHVTNTKYDVLQYAFQVVMDPAEINWLIRNLVTRNFHTVLSLRCEPVLTRRGARPGAAGGSVAIRTGEGLPEYGSSPVMAVTLQCEVVLMKSPQSWRDKSTPAKIEETRQKRRAFFRTHADMVLKVVRDVPGGGTVDLLKYEDLVADRSRINPYLQGDDPTVRFIALYEDLMPREIQQQQPGLQP